MEKHEEKQYINILAVIGVVFIMGILLGNIIVAHVQDNKISIEPTQAESMMYLKKPLPIKHFLYEGATLTSEGRFVSIIINEEITAQKENIKKPEEIIEETTVEELTIEELTTQEIVTEEVSATENETEIASEEVSHTESKETTTETETETEFEETTVEEKTKPIIKADHYACSLDEIYFTSPVRTYTAEQKELIAKMLYCEARGSSWDGQVATCSAIINHIEHNKGNFAVLDKSNHFSPASFYRRKTPNQMQYDVLDYVLDGHLIANVKYFRMSRYHSFGTPMFAIDGEYFSR